MEFNWDALQDNVKVEEKKEKKGYTKDERFLTITRDENDVSSTLVRFLPDPSGTPFIKRFSHSIRNVVGGKPRYYIQPSPSTIGAPCPASEKYFEVNDQYDYKAGEKNPYSRKTTFLANVQIIKCPGNPDIEGKVFLYEYGVKIQNKIMEAMNLSDDELDMGETPKQLFNPLKGNNFLIKTARVSNFVNYDKSAPQEKETALFKSKDAAVKYIKENCYDLGEFLQETAFLPYDELQKKLDWCFDVKTSGETGVEKSVSVEVEKKSEKKKVEKVVEETVETTDDESIDDLLNDLDLD